jgi:hypothetical protein
MDGLRYIGAGAWIPGVPARDLSAEEAEQHAAAIEAAAQAGHILYESVTKTAAKRAPKKGDEDNA